MKKWLELLTVVLDEFVETKCGVDNMEFWDRICHFSEGGSGPTYLSGWITTFAVFDKDGTQEEFDISEKSSKQIGQQLIHKMFLQELLQSLFLLMTMVRSIKDT